MDVGIFRTKKELDALVRDFRTFTNVFRYVTVGVYLVYVVYRLVVGTGLLPVNILLLAATIAYLVALVVFSVRGKRGKNSDGAQSVAGRVYRYIRFAAVAFSAVVSVVGILSAAHQPSPFSVVLAILMPVCLVLQVIFDVFIVLLSARVARFKAALSADIEMLKKDMVKIALDLLKNSLFHKEGKKRIEEETDQEPLIVVGSDDPASVRMMKKVADGVKKEGFFSRLFSGRKKREKTEESQTQEKS